MDETYQQNLFIFLLIFFSLFFRSNTTLSCSTTECQFSNVSTYQGQGCAFLSLSQHQDDTKKKKKLFLFFCWCGRDVSEWAGATLGGGVLFASPSRVSSSLTQDMCGVTCHPGRVFVQPQLLASTRPTRRVMWTPPAHSRGCVRERVKFERGKAIAQGDIQAFAHRLSLFSLAFSPSKP